MNEDRSVSDSHTSQITVTYRDGGVEVTRLYAVDEDVSRELDRQLRKPTGKDLQAWLEKKGCRLDWSGGPALVHRDDDGSMVERHYRDGKPHREDGPAYVWHNDNGTTVERYYGDGRQHREDGPAVLRHGADSATVEEYYRDDKLNRIDDLAYVRFEKRRITSFRMEGSGAESWNQTSIVGKSMTGSETSYITVTYRDGDEISSIYIYAVDEDISRELDGKRDWVGRKLTGRKLQAWLEKKGCQEIPWVNY